MPDPADPSPISHDLPCLRCRYNLRTLLPAARCPECNSPVADSLEFHRKYADLHLRTLIVGTLLLAAFPLTFVLYGLFLPLLKSTHFEFEFGRCCFFLLFTLLQALWLLAAILLFRRGNPRWNPPFGRGLCLVYPTLTQGHMASPTATVHATISIRGAPE